MTSRWGALILLTLQGNTLRFGELRRAVGGISDRTLAQTLQVLEGDGLVCRKDYKQIPPKVEYSLTPLGEDATETLRPLADWIETNLSQIAKHWS